MRVPLAAVSDDSDGLPQERLESGIALVINLRGHASSPMIVPAPRAAHFVRTHRPEFLPAMKYLRRDVGTPGSVRVWRRAIPGGGQLPLPPSACFHSNRR